MPNRKAHLRIGTVSGIFAGSVAVISLPFSMPAKVCGVIGGAIGGRLFSLVPDQLEPSFKNPNHRGVVHSWTATAWLGSLAYYGAAQMRPWCERKILELRHAAATAPTDEERRHASACECGLALAVGFFAGGTAGVLSHLVADSLTPQSLSLIGER